MASIRSFLVIVLLSTICLVNFAAAINGYRSSLREADSLLHKQLQETAQLLEGTLLDGAADYANTELASTSEHAWFQIWQQQRLRLRSPLAPGPDFALQDAGFHRLSFNGHSWMVLVHPAHHDTAGQRVIVVAQRADIYQGLMERMLLESILPIVWVLPLLGLVIWMIVGFGLRPLNRLARLLRSRRGGDFTPLQLHGCPEELDEVVRSTNTLLAELARAFEREQRFAADAAHELRTPLAALKVNLHNLAQEGRIPGDDIKPLMDSTERMGHAIEQLLALYRLAPGEGSLPVQLLDLAALAREVVADSYPQWEARQQQVELDARTANVRGDRFALQTLLRNLLDNAIKYTPEGGQIQLQIKASSAGVEVRLEDSGPGIPEDARLRVFDRFYRLGGDRHASKTIGSGLGLSIVDHIVRLHHGTIELGHSAALGGLQVRVWLPVLPAAGAGE
ncbi:HAMP domain-containing sensor histidine kinase [Pseudomaricurvus sp. HS19]|uniref:sensor histidine kinase n=1 Tax=Pseudomaricurvus sp. HS19 TaxID=2692626 RepID=UPI00136C18A7|nr:ATP-binding protein [Pseudomaricurvus sp. HS19]MYM64920.1 sensor histidine kinase [Pseudomaricurvus sp. HS19]